MRLSLASLLVLLCVAAGPASQPAQSPEVADLRRIIAGLQMKIAALEEENAKLKRTINAMPAKAKEDQAHEEMKKRVTAKESMFDMTIAERIKEGMTEDEVRSIIPRKPQREDRFDKTISLTWVFVSDGFARPPVMRSADPLGEVPGGRPDPSDPTNFGDVIGSVSVTINNGKVVTVHSTKRN